MVSRKPGATPAFNTIEEIETAVHNQRVAQAMTRNDMLKLGFLRAEELDDEEICAGRARDPDGVIRKNKNRTDPLPTDIYNAVMQEQQFRMNDRLREEMNASLEVMIQIRDDLTAEPRDRMEAAKYIFERVNGKTPDRVQVAVAKAPWEEVFAGLAAPADPQNPAAPRELMPYGYIQKPTDASVLDVDEVPLADQDGYQENASAYSPSQTATPMPNSRSDTSHPVQAGPLPPYYKAQPKQQPQHPTEGEVNGNSAAGTEGPILQQPVGNTGGGTAGDSGDLADSAPTGSGVSLAAPDEVNTVPDWVYAPPGSRDNPVVTYAAPDFRHPVNTSSTAPGPEHATPAQYQEQYAEPHLPLSTQLRKSQESAEALAEARKAAREMRKGAVTERKVSEAGKARAGAVKRRIIQRTLGLDALHPLDIAADIKPSADGTEELSWRVT